MIGFFNCNKSRGVSSAYVVNKIKKATKEKCGHLGTLDPNATGVLPIAVGKATRFFDYFLNKDKIYIATCRFGQLTTTLDEEGDILREEDVDVSESDIQANISQLRGEILQVPPIYSAISINGKRAYEYAKENIELELTPRKCNIYKFELLRKERKNEYTFLIHCSAGTYVRSLLLDLAKTVGTVSTTIMIDRQKSGAFEIKNACGVEEICKNPQTHLISIEQVFPDIKKVVVTEKEFKDIADGKLVSKSNLPENEFFVYTGDGKIVCFAENVFGKIKSKIYLYTEEE